MNLPFALPDWLPAWAFLLLALPVLLYALVFFVMPFNVFGLKARLEAIESQLDSIHEELRGMSSRPFSPASRPVVEEPDFDTLPHFGRLKSSRLEQAQQTAPPIPPPPLTPVVEPRAARLPQRPLRRTEPRLD